MRYAKNFIFMCRHQGDNIVAECLDIPGLKTQSHSLPSLNIALGEAVRLHYSDDRAAEFLTYKESNSEQAGEMIFDSLNQAQKDGPNNVFYKVLAVEVAVPKEFYRSFVVRLEVDKEKGVVQCFPLNFDMPVATFPQGAAKHLCQQRVNALLHEMTPEQRQAVVSLTMDELMAEAYEKLEEGDSLIEFHCLI